MNKKISLGMAVSIAAIVAAFAVVITYTAAIRVFDSRMRSVTERQNMYQVLSEIDMTVRQHYFGDISENYLQKNISQGYILGLEDSYSGYLSADEYQLALGENLGYTFGLGMDVDRSTEGYILTAARSLSTTPAFPPSVTGISPTTDGRWAWCFRTSA